MTLAERDWDAALAALRSAGPTGHVLAVGHINPDGDALGSLLAFVRAGRQLGWQVTGSYDAQPWALPPALAWLVDAGELVPPAQAPASPSLLVTFDTGSADRLGALADRVPRAGAVLVVDHHATNTLFGSVHLVDVAAASTTEIVSALLDRLGVELTAALAEPLYAGLITDTGAFRYAATTPATHLLAARLLATGFAHDAAARRLFDTSNLPAVRLTGTMLARADLADDVVGTWVDAGEISAAGCSLSDLEGVVDVLRTAVEGEVAAVLKGDADGTWKVSMRSQGHVDIGTLCQQRGGGGHRFAAGFTATGPAAAVLQDIRVGVRAAPRLDR